MAFWAFVPNRLPPAIEFDLELARLQSEADRAVGELAGLGGNLINPRLLIGPLMRREAVLSSRIEGTQTGVAGLYAFEAGQLPLPGIVPSATDAREVLNYVRALEYGIERLKTLPVSLRLMGELHAKLMEGARGEHMLIGQFRQHQNLIGRPGDGYAEASYVPPPVAEMKAALGDLETYLHQQQDDYSPLVRLAFIHYQFEAIHPFMDGNGRIGRLLLALLLVEWKLLPLPLLYLSAYFERDRDAYYAGLSAVSGRGAWREWVAYVLSGVRDQARDAVALVRGLTDLREEWRKRLAPGARSAAPLQLADQLFETPIVTIPRVAERLNIQYPSAKRAVEKLLEAGILTLDPGSVYDKTYRAQEIIRVVSETR
jgi:Fic family protein